MEKHETIIEQFKKEYKSFLERCNELNDTALWNKEEYGDMEAYFTNDLCCILIVLIAADGYFDEAEVRFINATLNLDYDENALKGVYDQCKDDIDQVFEHGIPESKSILWHVDFELVDTYERMLKLLCEVVSTGDGVVTPEEQTRVKQLMDMI